MKVHTFRHWHLSVVLLAVFSGIGLAHVRAQAPQPAATPPTEPQPGVTPAATPAAGTPERVPPPTTAAAPQAKPPAGAEATAKKTGANVSAERRPSWGVTASAGAYYIEKMRRIIFPKVQVTGASMEEVVGLLRTKSREYDNLEKDPAKKGVNLILKPGTAATAVINLDLKDVPMAEVLKYATELAGMKYKVEAFAVVVAPSSEWETEMFTRTFRVPPDFSTSKADGSAQTPVDYLKALGIPFPEGATASYVPGSSQLRVRNTREGLEILEMMFEALQGHSPAGAWGSVYYAEKLQRIILPSISFRGAILEEAVEHIRIMGRDLDTFERDPEKKGFNIVLRPEAAANKTPINLDLKEVPMSEALKYVTELAGVKFKIEPYAVVITTQSEAATELYTHIFKVPSNFLNSAGGGPEATAKDVLTAHGVQFPEGVTASLLPDPSLLMVRHTMQGLYEVEIVIENLMKRPATASQTAVAAPIAADHPVKQRSVSAPRAAEPPSSTPPAAAATPARIVAVEGGGLVQVAPGENFFLEAHPAGIDRSGSPSSETSRRTQQLLRDTELKVLLRHFETTVGEIADREKALLVEVDAAKRDELQAKLTALKGWKDQLVKRINSLTGATSAPASSSAEMPARNYLGLLQSSKAAYAPEQATGPADANNNGGDSANAWAAASTDAPLEWLSLNFEREADLAEIHIHETNATGALSRVVASLTRDGRGVQEFVVWNGREPRESTPFVRHIALPANFPFSSTANGIRLEFQPTRIGTWQEIDAVMLVGRDGSRQWAKEAKASSFWGAEKFTNLRKVPGLSEVPILGPLFQVTPPSEAPSEDPPAPPQAASTLTFGQGSQSGGGNTPQHLPEAEKAKQKQNEQRRAQETQRTQQLQVYPRAPEPPATPQSNPPGTLSR